MLKFVKIVRTDVPVRPVEIRRDGGLSDVVGPLLTIGLTDADIVTLPENPFRLVSVRLEVLLDPLMILRVVELVEREKSVTWNMIIVELFTEPLVPVTVSK